MIEVVERFRGLFTKNVFSCNCALVKNLQTSKLELRMSIWVAPNRQGTDVNIRSYDDKNKRFLVSVPETAGDVEYNIIFEDFKIL